MKTKWKKIVSLLLALLILTETFLTPVAAAEAQEPASDTGTAELMELSSVAEEPELVG